MKNEFIPFQQSLELKELGFDEPSLGRFYTKPKCKMFGIDEEERYYPIKNTPKKLYILGEHFVLNDDNVITAPLYQQVFRWFREKYNAHIYPQKFTDNTWYVSWGDWESPVFETYEEAELECLNKLIEIAKL
jgi:hypothetical protein